MESANYGIIRGAKYRNVPAQLVPAEDVAQEGLVPMSRNDTPTNKSTTSIYALCDPRDGGIRYVGKSDAPEDRLRRHMGPQELRADTYKARWIKQLMAEGLSPNLIILEEVSRDDWQRAERKWIEEIRSQGAVLTNTCEGGLGRTPGLGHTPESVAKIKEALIGRPVSQETRNKIRAKLEGRPLPADHREKLSEAQKILWGVLTPAEREGRLANLRHGWSEESRAKMSRTMTGWKRRPSASSKYLGVTFFKRDSKWRAYVNVDKKQIHLGYFTCPIEAAIARDVAALVLHGEFAALNFPHLHDVFGDAP